MSHGTVMQLEAELEAEFANAPTGVISNAHLALHKKPVAFNAVTHGLSGQHLILTFEDLPHYARMALDYIRELKPVGVRETANAQLIFESRWRTHRILSVENDLFVYQQPLSEQAGPTLRGRSVSRHPALDRQVNAFREEARNIDILSRYETRLIRNAGRLTEELKVMRTERAVESPELDFDERTSPAILWYRKVLARCEALAKARQAEEKPEISASATPEVLANKAETPFGKITSLASPKPANPPLKARKTLPDRSTSAHKLGE